MPPYYYLFNMSSYRRLEIQNDLPKIPKVKLICYFFNKVVTNNPLLYLFYHFLTTIQLHLNK